MPDPSLNRPGILHSQNAEAQTPDERGYYGPYGGAFVPETLRPALQELEAAFKDAMKDPEFHRELKESLALYSGRPTPLYHAERLSEKVGAKVLLKREDLNHTGAHKVNNTLGQILLAKRMGKTRIIAETGAGQHGVGTACVAARMGLQCEIHMGEEDIRRQHPNVLRMQLMGAKVIPATCGTRTLKDATSEAIRDWVANVENTYYLIGSVMGPHPYPLIVREFQSVIGREAREQCLKAEGRLPDIAVACVGGGSNAMGMFHPFLKDTSVKLVGVEAAGEGLEGRHAATMAKGTPGVLHGMFSYVLQDEDGQIQEAHSVSAGLDYPGVGPEHAYFKDTGRAIYESATDAEALAAFEELSRLEGIIPAFESSHALAWVLRNAGKFDKNTLIALCLSGRGDKDLDEYMLRTGKR